MRRKINLEDISLPESRRKDSELRWVCNSLGLVSGRDRGDTSFRIMDELLDMFKHNSRVSTEEVSSSLGIESPRTNHHIRSLVESGILSREKRQIVLREKTLTDSIREIKRDAERVFDRLIKVADRLDSRYGLK